MWLVFLVLALTSHQELVMALWCYACHEPTSVSSCITITEYNANETLCKTILYTLEILYPFLGDSTVTKSCSSKCETLDINGIGQTYFHFLLQC